MNNIYTKAAKNTVAAFVLLLSVSVLAVSAVAAPPVNDNFANAQTLVGNSGQAVVVSNSEATKETNEPVHAFNRGGRSVWYKFVAAGNGVLTLSTASSLFNTTLAVYTGSNVGSLTRVGANNDKIEGFGWSARSRVVVGTQTGTTYYIAVDGNYADNGSLSVGNVVLDYSFTNVAANDNFVDAIRLEGNNDGGTTVTTNVGASKEAGEPDHALNAGGRSVWFKWTAEQVNGIRTMEFSIDSIAVAGGNTDQSLFAMYTGSSVNALTEVARGARYFYSKVVFTPTPGTTYYIAIDGHDGGSGANLVTTTVRFRPARVDKNPDVDGDGKTDLSVYRPTTGIWYSLESTSDKMRAVAWGTNGDKPLFVDKDRDGELDHTVFRPDTGIWYTDRSSIQANEIFNWGINTDIPMFRRRQGAFETNDAVATVFRPSTGTWYLYFGANSQAINWGLNGDIPVLADFTGDGSDDLTVFRPSTGKWYILLNQNTMAFQEVQFGLSGDKPVPADYDGDGRADIAVYRPSNGTWYVLRSSDGGFQAAQFGLANDKPQPADYDGDTKADYAIYRNGIWWIYQSSTGTAKAASFGLSTDIPITAPAN